MLILTIVKVENINAVFFDVIYSVLTILNAAPACPHLDPEFFKLTDIFCVNETEVLSP